MREFAHAFAGLRNVRINRRVVLTHMAAAGGILVLPPGCSARLEAAEPAELRQLRAAIEKEGKFTVPYDPNALRESRPVFTPIDSKFMSMPNVRVFYPEQSGAFKVAIRAVSDDFGVIPISKANPQVVQQSQRGARFPRYECELVETSLGNHAVVFDISKVDRQTKVTVQYDERFVLPQYPTLTQAPREEQSAFHRLFPGAEQLADTASQYNRLKNGRTLCDARGTAVCTLAREQQDRIPYTAEYMVGVSVGNQAGTHATNLLRNGKYVAFIDAQQQPSNRVVGPLHNFVPGGLAPARGGHGRPNTVEGFGGELLAFLSAGVRARRERLLLFPAPREVTPTESEQSYLDALRPLVEKVYTQTAVQEPAR